MSQELYNLEVEKHLLACLLQNPDGLGEISILNEKDFSPINSSIYKIICNEINSGRETSSILLSDKIKSYNIQLDGVDPYDYIEALKLIPINESELVPLAKKLKKLTVLREYEEIGKQIVRTARKSTEKEFVDIVNEIDGIYNNKVNQFAGNDDEPVDLFEGLIDEIEEAGNNPHDPGIVCPCIPIYTKIYGSFCGSTVRFYAARSKSGKSTFLLNLAFDMVNNPQNGKMKVLICDTEMTTQSTRRRLLSAISGVSSFYLKSGLWRKHPDMEKKVRAAWKVLPQYMDKIEHIYVGGKPYQEIESLIRRWYGKNIARYSDIKCAIFFDYVKLGAESPTASMKEYTIIGKKVDSLKKIASDFNIPIITACQTNRSNEGRKDAENIIDDGSSIGLSDQINQYSDSVDILRKLTIEEAQEFGNDITHMLIPVYHRELGEDPSALGLVRYLDSNRKLRYRENFIRLKIHNFKIEERGDFASWVKAMGKAPATEAQVAEAKKQGLL